MPYKAEFSTAADTPEELEAAIADIAEVAKAAVRGKAAGLTPNEEYSSVAVFRLTYTEPGDTPK